MIVAKDRTAVVERADQVVLRGPLERMNLQRRLGPIQAVGALGIGQGAAAELHHLALVDRRLLRFARQAGAVPAAVSAFVKEHGGAGHALFPRLIVDKPGLRSLGHFLHDADSEGNVRRLEAVAALLEVFLEIAGVGFQQLLAFGRNSCGIERDLQLALLDVKPVDEQEQAAIAGRFGRIRFGGAAKVGADNQGRAAVASPACSTCRRFHFRTFAIACLDAVFDLPICDCIGQRFANHLSEQMARDTLDYRTRSRAC